MLKMLSLDNPVVSYLLYTGTLTLQIMFWWMYISEDWLGYIWQSYQEEQLQCLAVLFGSIRCRADLSVT